MGYGGTVNPNRLPHTGSAYPHQPILGRQKKELANEDFIFFLFFSFSFIFTLAMQGERGKTFFLGDEWLIDLHGVGDGPWNMIRG